jgi:spore cortex formation protein SpoVR/YcgB (stage V sporulation)
MVTNGQKSSKGLDDCIHEFMMNMVLCHTVVVDIKDEEEEEENSKKVPESKKEEKNSEKIPESKQEENDSKKEDSFMDVPDDQLLYKGNALLISIFIAQGRHLMKKHYSKLLDLWVTY